MRWPSQAMRQHWRKFETLTFDIVDSSLQDMLTTTGFITLVRQICRVRGCGMVVLAPVCSSFSWMCRYSTGRSITFPLGNEAFTSVAEANMLVSRTIMILSLIIARGCVFVLEQPLGSIMPQHPRFQQFLADHVVWKVSLHMPPRPFCECFAWKGLLGP